MSRLQCLLASLAIFWSQRLVYSDLDSDDKKNIVNDDIQLSELLNTAHQALLYSGTFGAITAFVCRDVAARSQLLLQMSRIGIAANVVDIESGLDQLVQLAWLAFTHMISR
ncbi:hypothetical protein QAD02_012029 [Eretmocerus hayati]|uniref:Uncharacterized protein n=1 Tax=Eretmocerus hayati TaxID=131215 RepID=A0ACC2NZH2_9HYME|nr:hypothetical protein QAD02_012029 [Eretmocerus hayati]